MSNLKTPIRLIGFLGNEPQVQITRDNKKVVRISLAVNENRKATRWHKIVF
jgi:single-stranded DNA-binding protein